MGSQAPLGDLPPTPAHRVSACKPGQTHQQTLGATKEPAGTRRNRPEVSGAARNRRSDPPKGTDGDPPCTACGLRPGPAWPALSGVGVGMFMGF